jgi:hypothetical protein
LVQYKKEWNNTEVVFELLEENELISLISAWCRKLNGYDVCEKGWDGHITESLVKFINE